MENEKWKIFGSDDLRADTDPRHDNAPQGLLLGRVGQNRKAPDRLSSEAARTHRNTVESRSVGLYSDLFPKCQGVVRTAFLILFSTWHQSRLQGVPCQGAA